MENSLKNTSNSHITYTDVQSEAKRYLGLLPWRGRHDLIIDRLSAKGKTVTKVDVKRALYGSSKNLDILLTAIELGKAEEEKINAVMA